MLLLRPGFSTVMATGFETGYNAATMGPQKLGYDIIGRAQQSLSAKWAVEGPKTFEGYCSSGFPNLFMQVRCVWN